MLHIIWQLRTFVSGLFTGREPMVWAAIAAAFITDSVLPVLEEASQAEDVYQLVGILLVGFVARSQWTPLKNRS